MPFQPRSFDLWTFDKVSALITEARQYRDSPLRAVVILNFADPAGGDNVEAAKNPRKIVRSDNPRKIVRLWFTLTVSYIAGFLDALDEEPSAEKVLERLFRLIGV